MINFAAGACVSEKKVYSHESEMSTCIHKTYLSVLFRCSVALLIFCPFALVCPNIGLLKFLIFKHSFLHLLSSPGVSALYG